MHPIATSHSTEADQRAASRVDVDLLINKYIDGQPHLARASNLSRKGLLVHRLFEPHRAHTSVGLQFQLPDSDRIITCAGRVVYAHPCLEAFGIEFTDLTAEHRDAIDAYITSQAR